ncbi:MAG: hypothetical protein QY320_00010 [Gammaproteobacteria bacterium]|nr:MAG: hypothetical protein QY320_00010 [Gammaproteobacteria bacterium]
MSRIPLSLVVLLSAWTPTLVLALDCSSPTLKGASGVISNKHSYKVTGDCSHSWQQTESGATSSTTTNYGIVFAYVGSASWDRLSGEAVEKIKFTGDATGQRHASANCTQDPFLKDPPGGAAKCTPITVQAEIDAGTIYEQLLKPQFWAGQKLSLTEAQALSALPPPSQPPAPEKPTVPSVSADQAPADARVGGVASPGPMMRTPDVVASQMPPQDPVARAAVIEQMQRSPGTARGPASDSRSASQRTAPPPAQVDTRVAAAAVQPAQMEIEGEAFVTSGAFQLNGGQARVQEMSGFGSGWSGNAQLFWSDGTPGAVLDLLVDVPAAAKYALEIYMTRAPDFGQISFEIDGQPSPVTFDGMAPTVMTSGPIQLGTFPLQAGQRRVSMMITGKYAQSSNFYIGIDKLRLYPAGPIN